MADIDRAIATIAAAQHGAISRPQADGAGCTRKAMRTRVETGRWRQLLPGVYLVNGAPLTWRTTLMAACLRSGGVVSHRTAAHLHGIAGFPPEPVDLIVPRNRKVVIPGATLHQSTDFDWFEPVTIDGIPVTPVDRLAVDLGAVVSFARYTRAIDDLLLRRLFTWDVGFGVLMRYGRKGRNGVGALRALVDHRYGESIPDSALELAFQRLLAHNGVPEPVGQFVVVDEQGFIGRVDFAYPELRIAIELNGMKYHLNAESFENDHRRVARLQRAGWHVLSFTWQMVIDTPDVVIAAVRTARRGQRLVLGPDLAP